MSDLGFRVESIEAIPFAASPQLVFRLRVTNSPVDQELHAIALRCQIRIDPAARSYSDIERSGMLELFGEPSRWGQTLRSMLWTHATAMVPSFTGETRIELPIPCTFDFSIATTKYFHALRDGSIAVKLLFSGTVFYRNPDGDIQVSQVPWDREADCRLPASVWQEMMDQYYPNSAWLCLHRSDFNRLAHFKAKNGLATWERVWERLLPRED